MSRSALLRCLWPLLACWFALSSAPARAALPDSLFVRFEYLSSSGSYPQPEFWLLEQGGPVGIVSLTPEDGDGAEPPIGSPPYDWSIAFIGHSLVITALEENNFADSGWYPMAMFIYDAAKEPIHWNGVNEPENCQGEGCANYLASVSPWTFPSMQGDTLRVAIVPEPETWTLTLAGLGLIGWTLRRRRSAMRG